MILIIHPLLAPCRAAARLSPHEAQLRARLGVAVRGAGGVSEGAAPQQGGAGGGADLGIFYGDFYGDLRSYHMAVS